MIYNSNVTSDKRSRKKKCVFNLSEMSTHIDQLLQFRNKKPSPVGIHTDYEKRRADKNNAINRLIDDIDKAYAEIEALDKAIDNYKDNSNLINSDKTRLKNSGAKQKYQNASQLQESGHDKAVKKKEEIERAINRAKSALDSVNATKAIPTQKNNMKNPKDNSQKPFLNKDTPVGIFQPNLFTNNHNGAQLPSISQEINSLMAMGPIGGKL